MLGSPPTVHRSAGTGSATGWCWLPTPAILSCWARIYRAIRPSWRPSGCPTPLPNLRHSCTTPVLSPTGPALLCQSTSAGPCPTGRLWRNHVTWRGSWPHTHATAFRGLRDQATPLRSPPYDRPWRRRWASGSRVKGDLPSFSFDTGANPLLRGFLGLGAMGAAAPDSDRRI